MAIQRSPSPKTEGGEVPPVANTISTSSAGRSRPDLFDVDLEPGAVGGEELVGETEAGRILAVLLRIPLVLQGVRILRVDRGRAADGDDPASVPVGVQVQADPRMVPDVADLGRARFGVDDDVGA